MRSKTFAMFALVVLGVGLVTGSAVAQAGRGTARINGTVVDETGNPVPGAKVALVLANNEAVKRETVADKKGEWAIIGLGTSQWTLTAVAEGFQPATMNIQVKQLERNPTLTVTVKKAAAGNRPMVQDEASLALIDQANQLYTEGNYDGALTIFREILTKNPGIYQVNMNIGDCLREKGEIDQALETYNGVIEQAKADPQMGKEMTAKALARIGECHLKKGDFETAQGFFKQSIETLPEDEVLAYNVGEIYFSNQKLDEAITYFGLATKIKPDWSEGYYKLGLAYLNKAEYELARQSLSKVLELEPEGERSAIVKGILDTIDKIKK
ncbi:MAG TPA: tetratricopeptide repeat protein [Acidobacteriota bacterium]|nr:tetratricopeptide repeat protein [Acidobacteriota bacterium]